MSHTLLTASQRSPKEEFRYSNYPEVALIQDRLQTMLAYTQEIQEAVDAYNERRAEKIYLNVAELREMLTLAEDVADVLGNAPNVCYELLITVRDIQEGFHELLYSNLADGNLIVSTLPYNPYIQAEKDQEKGMI